MGINDLTRISPRGLIRGGGLICFKKILHGGLFEGGGLIEALRYTQNIFVEVSLVSEVFFQPQTHFDRSTGQLFLGLQVVVYFMWVNKPVK